jgi:MarR family transcriptional repressor of mepA
LFNDKVIKDDCDQDIMPVNSRLRLLGNGFKQRFNNSLRQYDLTVSQFGVICFLQQHQGERIYIKKIGEVFNLTHPTVVGLINRLEEKGFVQTAQDPGNKKYRIISLTQKGLAIKARMDSGRDEMEHLILKGFSDEETKEFKRLLDKALDNIKNDA